MSINLLNSIMDRRSIKEYTSEEVHTETLLKVLEACRWAPSAHNAQPWRFIVIRDSLLKNGLAERMATRWKEDLSRDLMPEEQQRKLIYDSIRRFKSAPIIIIACLIMEEMDNYSDEFRRKAEYVMGVQSVAAALENLLLAIHVVGLGACWYCTPLSCPDIVRELLDIPEEVEPQALITVGHQSFKPDPPLRKRLNSVVFEELWGHRI